MPSAEAHSRLRTVLWRIHQSAPGFMSADREAVRLETTVEVDVVEFRARALESIKVGSGLDLDELTFGGLLSGWSDDWVYIERERVLQLQLHALEVLASESTRTGHHGEAIQAALLAVSLEPLRESAVRLLIEAHLAQGNTAAALKQYQAFERLLKSELGLSPTRELQQTMAPLRSAGPRSARRSLKRRTTPAPLC
jgi:DNA-binding SARP family transcriptional activator